MHEIPMVECIDRHGMESDGDGHQSPRDRNVDFFDEHRESTKGDISVPLLLMGARGFRCAPPPSAPISVARNRSFIITPGVAVLIEMWVV